MDILLVAFSALVGSLFSLVGGLYLIYGGKKALTLQRLSVPFAAGSLLAAAFTDLLPEAVDEADADIIIYALLGLVVFFLLERVLSWFHHHHSHGADDRSKNAVLIIVGDTLHNLIDGVAIGAAFLVNPVTGIVATIAVAAHEVPQEIGDFGLLLAKGVRRRTVLVVNILSALVTVMAATSVFALGSAFELPLAGLLAATAGFFIYIAASDIIPGIHGQTSSKEANTQTILLLLGVVVVSVATAVSHGFVDVE